MITLNQELIINNNFFPGRFKYEVYSEMNKLFDLAEIILQRNIYLAFKPFSIAKGNSMIISLGCADDEMYYQFQGVITGIREYKGDIVLEARNFTELNKSMLKTYEGVKPSFLFSEFSKDIQYTGPEFTLDRFMADGQVSTCVKSLVRTIENVTSTKLYAYTDYDKLIITKTPQRRELETDSTAVFADDRKIKIIANPNLKLGDILIYDGAAYLVKSIRNDGVYLHCGVEYEG